jgi:lysophospholipase L1-like esterase
MPTDEYAQRLRSLIQIARSGNGALPVRIVEIAEFAIRANVKEAQRQVATDSGVELIPTADLQCADPACHLTPQGYQTVRDRISRSIGR